MGESDAHSVSFTWSRDPKPEAEEQADHRDILRQKQALDVIKLSVFGEPEPVRVLWPGKDWELAAKVENDLTLAHGRTPTPAELTEGFKQACRDYKKKNGRLFTPKGLRDTLKVHRQWVKEHSYPHPRATKISPR